MKQNDLVQVIKEQLGVIDGILERHPSQQMFEDPARIITNPSEAGEIVAETWGDYMDLCDPYTAQRIREDLLAKGLLQAGYNGNLEIKNLNMKALEQEMIATMEEKEEMWYEALKIWKEALLLALSGSEGEKFKILNNVVNTLRIFDHLAALKLTRKITEMARFRYREMPEEYAARMERSLINGFSREILTPGSEEEKVERFGNGARLLKELLECFSDRVSDPDALSNRFLIGVTESEFFDFQDHYPELWQELEAKLSIGND